MTDELIFMGNPPHGPPYPLLSIKYNKKGQRSENLSLEAVWKEISRAGATLK